MDQNAYLKTKFPENYKSSYIIKDILSGIIVALVSIPISMGYAQIAGLPMIYGLYGSFLPILVFGIITSSYDFVFGVNAAPAALTGGTIAALHIASGSEEAINAVPVLTFLVGLWLLLFFFLKAGRAVKYISVPVMGGFITGICLEIISMQLPKLWGGGPGTGELPELILHWVTELKVFNPLSFCLGIMTVVIILVFKKLLPKLPMSVVMLVIGILLNVFFRLENYGIMILPETSTGLPVPKLLHIDFNILPDLGFSALTIALVIMSETMLASRSNAIEDGYDLDTSREVLSYSMANIVSAVFGCCPVNASVSRTSIVRQFGGRSQIMSISASISMAVILIFCTRFIPLMPVPILTGIIIAALLSACEFHLAARLRKTSKRDFWIFISASVGVLFFGTVYGVVIGVILSFFAVIREAVSPPRTLVGIRPGHEGFYSLKAHEDAEPIPGVVIYRFGGNLFFANIDTFVNDIEAAINEETHVVIINASGINNVDITATDRLMALTKSLTKRGIRFFFAENDGVVNGELKRYGAGELLENGTVQKDIETCLKVVNMTTLGIKVTRE
ncbi:high affinity sulphate transporter 1 [Lachnospiraceae bacterium NE2001]|nr:high affinity sulphate transporter 1 [Lachnospiraceae bacterium NE2001]